ncbi:MAG: TIGR03617 family F420-dependent LLM class oxidoreductase [Myxococcota bacterium]
MLEVWANLDLYLPLSRVAEEAHRAEKLGYDVLCVPDLVHDGIAASTLAVQATERIRITTSALIAFPRSPMTVAVAAWDLQDYSEGRFMLGLGPQIRANIVDRFSTPWSPPAPRMREYVASLRAIFNTWQSGEPLNFQGDHYTFTRMQPYTSPPPLKTEEIPIRLSGIGPNMTALAGELADGINTHPTNACPRYLREHLRPNLARGAERVGRSLDEIHIVANPLCATGTTSKEVADQREEQRTLLATLFSTPSYWPSLELYGWEERGKRLNSLVREGRWNELTPLVDDEMLDAMVPASDYAGLSDILFERYSGIADAVTFPMPPAEADDTVVARAIARLRERA